MTRLGHKHPRKAWIKFQCDECRDLFWAPDNNSKTHACTDCRRPRKSVHFTSGSPAGNPGSERNYQGGTFHRGEW